MVWNYWKKDILALNPQFESQYKSQSADKSIIHYALENKSMSEDKYLTWAQQKFEWPLLNKNFKFTQTHFETWKKYQSLNLWNESTLPFYEWDQCLFVMTLEPIDHIQIPNFKIIPLLTSITTMNQFWTHVSSLNTKKNINDSTELILLDEPELLASESDAEANSDAEIEILEGFEQFTQPQILNSSTDPLKAHNPLVNLNQDSEFELQIQNVQSAELTSKHLDEEDDIPPDTMRIDLATLNLIQPPPASISASVKSPSYSQTATLDEDDDVPPDTMRIDLATLNEIKTDIKDVPKKFPDFYLMDSLQKENQSQITSTINTLFKNITLHFKSAGIFCFNKSESIAQVFKLDSQFQNSLECEIDLKKASFFKLILKTHKNFHGNLPESEMNAVFINKIYHGQKPANTTAAPIIVDHQVVGVIFATGPATTQSEDHLMLIENSAKNLSETFQKLQNQKNKAA